MIHTAFAVDESQKFADALFAGAAMGGMKGFVQNVQTLCSVQPLRSVQIVRTSGNELNRLNGLNDWNLFRVA